MRFFPRSGQFLSLAVVSVFFCGLCVPPGRAQDPTSNQQTGTRQSDKQQDYEPSLPLTLPPGVRQPKPFGQVESTIEVRSDDLINQISPVREGTREQVQSSAGTFQDFSRYLLLMPGTVANSDSFNDLMVRGGHPVENLYVVDGLEVPNINHFAVGGTTSGFTPMINTSTISKVTLQPGVYDSKYWSRLSSVVEIQTRDQDEAVRAGEINLGIAGVGGFWENPLGSRVSMLLAADRSLLNLATNDAGLDGVPVYTNGMARFEWSPDKKDTVSFLGLTGGDSIIVKPCAGDGYETLTIDTQYDGLQSTDGMVWQHMHGPTTLSKVTASFSMQKRDIGQQTQLVNGTYPKGTGPGSCTPPTTTPIYQEATFDKLTTIGYNLQHDIHHWLLSAGTTGQLVQLDYNVNQPQGTQSPFNPDPNWTDAVSFHQTPSAWQTGSYAELTGSAGKRWTGTAGVRIETFGLTSAHAVEPRAGLGFRLTDHQGVYASYRHSAQLAPYLDLLSYPQNRNLPPIEADQYSVGADLWRTDMLTVSLEGYRKNYTKEPVSTEYPSLMLANMIYTPGEQFVWLPLKTGGTGHATGLEFFLRGHLTDRMAGIASVTYSRTLYRAADGILRPGNYDFPLVANAMLTFQLPRAYTLSVRNSYTSGRPYTPYNIPLSMQQDRGIYDLSLVNGKRGPAYDRADISVDRNFYTHSGVVNLYVGLQNILDRKNFLGYVWLPRCEKIKKCVAKIGVPMKEINQMPAFPVAGVRWDF